MTNLITRSLVSLIISLCFSCQQRQIEQAKFNLEIQVYPSIYPYLQDPAYLTSMLEASDQINGDTIEQTEDDLSYFFGHLRIKGDYLFPFTLGFLPIFDLDFEDPNLINQTLNNRADILSIQPSLLPSSLGSLKKNSILWAMLLSFDPVHHQHTEPRLEDHDFSQKRDDLYQSPQKLKSLIHRYELLSLFFQESQVKSQPIQIQYPQLIQEISGKSKAYIQEDKLIIQQESGEWLWFESWLKCPNTSFLSAFETNIQWQNPLDATLDLFSFLGVCNAKDQTWQMPLIFTPSLDQEEPISGVFHLTVDLLDPRQEIKNINISYRIFNRDWQELSDIQIKAPNPYQHEVSLALNADVFDGQRIEFKIEAIDQDQQKYQKFFQYQSQSQKQEAFHLQIIPLLSTKPLLHTKQEIHQKSINGIFSELFCAGDQDFLCHLDPTQNYAIKLINDDAMNGGNRFKPKSKQWEPIESNDYALIGNLVTPEDSNYIIIHRFSRLAVELFADQWDQYQRFVHDFNIFFDFSALSHQSPQTLTQVQDELLHNEINIFWQSCFAYQTEIDEIDQLQTQGYLDERWTMALYLGCVRYIDDVKKQNSLDEQILAINLFKTQIPLLFETQSAFWKNLSTSDLICGLDDQEFQSQCLYQLSFRNFDNTTAQLAWDESKKILWTQTDTQLEIEIFDRSFEQNAQLEIFMLDQNTQEQREVICQRNPSHHSNLIQQEPYEQVTYTCPLHFDAQDFEALHRFRLGLKIQDGLMRELLEEIDIQLLPASPQMIDINQLFSSEICRAYHQDILHYDCQNNETSLEMAVLIKGFNEIDVLLGDIEDTRNEQGIIEKIRFQQLSNQEVNAYQLILKNPLFEITIDIEIHNDSQAPHLQLLDTLFRDERLLDAQRNIAGVEPTVYTYIPDQRWSFYQWFQWIKPTNQQCNPNRQTNFCTSLDQCQDHLNDRCEALQNRIKLRFEVDDHQASIEKLMLYIQVDQQEYRYDIYQDSPLEIDIADFIDDIDISSLSLISKDLNIFVKDQANNTSQIIHQQINIYPILPPVSIRLNSAPQPILHDLIDQPQRLSQRLNLFDLRVVNPHAVPLNLKIMPFDHIDLSLVMGLLEQGLDINRSQIDHPCLISQNQIITEHYLQSPIFQNMQFSGGECQNKRPWSRNLNRSQQLQMEYLNPVMPISLINQNLSIIHRLEPFSTQNYRLYLDPWDLGNDVLEMLNQTNDRLPKRYFKYIEDANGVFYSENREVNTFVYGFRLWYLNEIDISLIGNIRFHLNFDANIEDIEIQPEMPIPDFNMQILLP